MRREQLDEYTRLGRWVRGSMYLRKSRAEEHMSLQENGSLYIVIAESLTQMIWILLKIF